MQFIPTTSDGSRRFSVDFGGTIAVYVLRTQWNYQARMWFMDIFDENDQVVAYGLALVPDIDVLEAFPNLRAIFGEIRVADIANTGNATVDTLGTDSIVVRFDEGEFVPATTGIPDPLVNLDDVIQ